MNSHGYGKVRSRRHGGLRSGKDHEDQLQDGARYRPVHVHASIELYIATGDVDIIQVCSLHRVTIYRYEENDYTEIEGEFLALMEIFRLANRQCIVQDIALMVQNRYDSGDNEGEGTPEIQEVVERSYIIFPNGKHFTINPVDFVTFRGLNPHSRVA